jgi:hypothetical protein
MIKQGSLPSGSHSDVLFDANSAESAKFLKSKDELYYGKVDGPKLN